MIQTSGPVECWGIYEIALAGPDDGNPFLDVTLSAVFNRGHRPLEVAGFYDGDGLYRVRFMPDSVGDWTWTTRSNVPALDGKTGGFHCTAPSGGNHGPVQVRDRYHFAHADGAWHYCFGTTCYGWAHQNDALVAQTLDTLRTAGFNKMRMCVLPKWYKYCEVEPVHYPFAGQPPSGWDFTRFNPAFFRRFERQVQALMDLGLEADLILLHPYDHWGFARMDRETDMRYLRYTVARLAAFRNVWWSMANEYDLMKTKTLADWNDYGRLVRECDPYGHLIGIHNCGPFFDHQQHWITHQSIQHSDLAQTAQWRRACPKPVVVDECCYEGDVPHRWGNLTARQLVHRFWLGAVRGGYVGHGETYLHPQSVLWWSRGGVLHGESAPRIAFLRRLFEEGPPGGFEPAKMPYNYPGVGKADRYFLYYLDGTQPRQIDLEIPVPGRYCAELIDTWKMTITPLGEYEGRAAINLPEPNPDLAVRMQMIG